MPVRRVVVAVLVAGLCGIWGGASKLGAVRAPAGQEPEARAYLDSPRVGVGRQFVLNVELSGLRQMDSQPVLPVMDDFARRLGMGTTTSMQTVNGQTVISVVYQYSFMALKEGTFEIGPVEVIANGQSLKTEPVSLVVSDTPSPAAQPGSARAAEREGIVSPEDLFVETIVDKTRVFDNEPVTVEYRLYTVVNVESYTVTAVPRATGFWSEELEQPDSPRVKRVRRNGREYVSAVIRRAVLFPAGPGTKFLDPLAIEAQVRVRNRTFDPFGDIFSRSSLLGNRVPVAAISSPVEIEVIPVPESGRPPSFRGHIGTLTVSAAADRASVSTNEAITLRVSLTGTGNLRALAPPEIRFPPEFDVFPPEVHEQITPGGGSLRGSRTFEYVMVPRVAGTFTLSGTEVAAFDPAARAYRESRARPLVFEVTEGAAAAGEAGALPTRVTPVREEIRFIDVGAPHFAPADRRLFGTFAFWLVLLAPPAAAAGAGVFRRHRNRLEGDVAYARTRRARRMAKKRLAKAKGLASGDPRAFYAEVAGALQGFLADKMNVSAAGLVREEIGQITAERGVSEETLQQLFACLDDCDRQRFSPSGAQREHPDRVLARAARLMAELAKELSR